MLVSGLTTMAWIDFKTGYLPDTIQIALAIGGLTILIVGSPIGIQWIEAITGLLINGITFWTFGWIVSKHKDRDAMGLGDVKLVAVGGLWLGPLALPYLMALAGLITILGVILSAIITKKKTWKGEIPFGPGLASAILIIYICALFGFLQLSWTDKII